MLFYAQEATISSIRKGIHSYRLFNKWISRVDIASETADKVVLSTAPLKDYQKQYIYENYREDLKNIFNGKRITFAVM